MTEVRGGEEKLTLHANNARHFMVDTLLEQVIDIKSEDTLKTVNGTERPKQMINMNYF